MAIITNCTPACAPNEAEPLPGVTPPCATCDDGTGGGGMQADVEQLILCDIDANGEVVGTALAVYEYDQNGAPVGQPTFVNPATGAPYVVQGTLQPCPEATQCPAPMQFCFTSTSTGPVDHPGRMYDITLPINPGFAVESAVIGDVTHAANITWSIFDPDGEEFRQDLTTFLEGRMPSAATVTITNPNAGQVICGEAAPMTIHIECVRLDQNPPDLVELVYNGGLDLIQNPGYITTPPTNLSQFQFYYLQRQDQGGTINCTNTAGRGWETNDLGGNGTRDFEIWGTGPNGLQQQSGPATATPRGTPIQEVTADINDTGAGPTIWQTFNVPVAGNYRVQLVHGARDPGETHTIRLSTGDTDDSGPGDIVNDVTNPPSVTNSGGPNPWTVLDQTVPLNAGQYTFSFQTTNPVGQNRGGLFTDMRVYLDAPGERATANVDDDTCVVTTEETTTTTQCQYWAPSCVNGDIISWKRLDNGQVLSNAAFWGQSPAPSCCLPSSGDGGEGGSVSAGNLIHNYEICGTVGGVRQTLNRVVISDQSGGVIAATIIGPDGAPVTPAAGWTIGGCETDGGIPYETSPISICFSNEGVVEHWYTYERVSQPAGSIVRERHWYNPVTGADVTVQPAGTQVECPDTIEVTSIAEPGCANGVPWTRVTHHVYDPETQNFTPLTSFVDSGGTVVPAAPAGFTLGACAGSNQDSIVLCDPANNDQPVFVTITHNADGTTSFEYLLIGGAPFVGDPNTLVVCAGSLDPDLQEVDQYETAPVTACFAVGAPPNSTIERWFTFERVTWNNITQVETSRVRHWYNPLTGADVTAQPAGTPIDCGLTEVNVTESEELGCAAGVPWSRRRTGFFTVQGDLIATVYNFVDSAGNEQPTAPAGFTLGDCPTAADVNDVETFTELGCADGVPYTKRTSRVFNRNTGAALSTTVEYVDSANVPVAVPPANFVLGPCPHYDIETTSEPGCANGRPVTRIVRNLYDPVTGDRISSVVTYWDHNDVPLPAKPDEFVLGSCIGRVRLYTSTVETVTNITRQIASFAPTSPPDPDGILMGLVSVSVRHRSGTVTVQSSNTYDTNAASIVTLDPGEVIEFDAGDDPVGLLNTGIIIDCLTPGGSARVTYQFRLPGTANVDIA